MSTPTQLQQALELWTAKAAKLKLLNEHETYKWGYDVCLRKIALFQSLLNDQQAALCDQQAALCRSSSTKPSL